MLAASISASGAEAQPPHRLILQTCRSHAEMEAKLLEDFGEAKIGHGVSGDGSLVEVYAGPSGTFTVVKRLPGRASCIVDFGESWQTLSPLDAARWLEDGPLTTRRSD